MNKLPGAPDLTLTPEERGAPANNTTAQHPPMELHHV
jgi:hypothetical protein